MIAALCQVLNPDSSSSSFQSNTKPKVEVLQLQSWFKYKRKRNIYIRMYNQELL
jgi:hypothetical protein